MANCACSSSSAPSLRRVTAPATGGAPTAATSCGTAPGRRQRAGCWDGHFQKCPWTARMTGVDERPPIWIGHAFLTVSDLQKSADFWVAIGMSEIERNDEFGMMELRGGTHL